MRQGGHGNGAARKGRDPAVGRGRPPKFGRPSQFVALTLPQDVLQALRTLHRDPGWAIVQLVESTLGVPHAGPASAEPEVLAELVQLPGKRALIVVQPQPFQRLRGASTIPLADGRAFLAFDRQGGLADLEVAIVDELEASSTSTNTAQREQLQQILDTVRAWRRNPRLAFKTKSIIVVNGIAGAAREPLARLHGAAAGRRPRSRKA